ncbi:pseudaminic acid synthase [Celerinatantimonas yamalensis]|uniref:Pseudaminic acid synthase n=1 Tax=Celerinatantimonas yamalensis TaxID=559956 RepID=A0ABW9G5Z4_9GAMM
MNSRKCSFALDSKMIGQGHPVYIVAEMSTNHGGELSRAKEIIHAAAEAGADAVKLQTYTADTLTFDCSDEHFQLKDGLWAGQSLYELYQQVAMPWQWHEPLFVEAQKVGITLFSSPFDLSAVELLESLDYPAYKIASAEIIDVALLHAVAATGKPVIISTGGAALDDIQRAVTIMAEHHNSNLCLLKCTSAYPAPYESMNLKTITHLADWVGCPVGLSDHSLGISVPVAAVALGACFIEKHFMLDKSLPTADRAFSLDPSEFTAMVQAVRQTEQALGQVSYPQQTQAQRALYAIEDLAQGTVLEAKHLRSARPGGGIAPRHLPHLLGRPLRSALRRAHPLQWSML